LPALIATTIGTNGTIYPAPIYEKSPRRNGKASGIRVLEKTSLAAPRAACSPLCVAREGSTRRATFHVIILIPTWINVQIIVVASKTITSTHTTTKIITRFHSS
jgi:hypothetical protein